ncbi:MAG: TldD/PmbA family protein, partial [Proteobacteria bacterium]|nr:TldD/PmbA family protein [Pseudomonadota bacterium]
MNAADDKLNLLADLIRKATAAGADGADAVFMGGRSLSLTRRLGRPEWLDRSEGADVGLRVFIGKRHAIAPS